MSIGINKNATTRKSTSKKRASADKGMAVLKDHEVKEEQTSSLMDEQQGASTPPVYVQLRLTRLQKKIALSKVSAELRIREDYLEAIECDDQTRLPETAYTLGFVRSYANFLGFDGAALVQKYKEERLGHAPIDKGRLDMPVPLPAGGIPSRALLITIAVAVLVALVLGWVWLRSGEPAELSEAVMNDVLHDGEASEHIFLKPSLSSSSAQTTGSLPVAEETAKTVEEGRSAIAGIEGKQQAIPTPALDLPHNPSGQDQSPSSETTPTAKEDANQTTVEPQPLTHSSLKPQEMGAPVTSAHEVVLYASSESWVNVHDSKGHLVLNKVMKPGEKISIAAEKGTTLTTGNAGGIALEFKGKRLPPLGKAGEVRRYISLDPKDLLGESTP